ncbi:phage baseplate assembly protein V [Marinobacter sp. NFXS9]|uniref:phage baseplate assembly protein V n=1 Tax=Marinobacter sp. NFXS9 TaxID=2818433 RepID=UPI0032DF7880
MNTLAEAFRLINNLIRIGTIAEVDHDRARARVQAGDNLTGWQRWITLRAGTTVDWDPPTEGEQVVLISPSGDLAQAIIITGLFRQNAPSSSPDEHKRVYPDGSEITYDHVKKQLVANLVGKVNVNITGDATVNVGGNATTAVAGICKVNAEKIHHNDGNPVVTTGHVCHFTGLPHGDGSSTVTAGK